MKINWDRWIKRDKGTLLFAGFTLVCAAIAILYIDLTKPEVKKREDLFFIKDIFSDYSWIKYSKGSRLTFRLQHYNNNFQVKADFYSVLDKTSLNSISNGDTVEVSIPAESVKHLNTDGSDLLAFSLQNHYTNCMDYRDTIRKHNSNFIKIAAGVFFLIGSVSVYSGFTSKRK